MKPFWIALSCLSLVVLPAVAEANVDCNDYIYLRPHRHTDDRQIENGKPLFTPHYESNPARYSNQAEYLVRTYNQYDGRYIGVTYDLRRYQICNSRLERQNRNRIDYRTQRLLNRNNYRHPRVRTIVQYSDVQPYNRFPTPYHRVHWMRNQVRY